MFGNGLVEVAIGMVFVYLLLSLISSVLNEWIAGLLGMRARNLEQGIRSLFTDGNLTGCGADKKAQSLADAIYDHGLVQSLFRATWINKLFRHPGRPSYIPSRTFAAALLDVLAPADAGGSKDLAATRTKVNGLPDSKGKQALLAILGQVQGNIEEARSAIENWYNDGMDRVSGWYKRKSQMILLALAIIVTWLTNTDSILVAKTLWNSPTLRASTVAAAEDYVKNYDKHGRLKAKAPADQDERSSDVKTQVKDINDRLNNIQLPIGWPGKNAKNDDSTEGDYYDARAFPWNWPQGFFRVLGWFLTAIAISLGAPFWFDVLNKFMVVRSTVKPQEKSAPEGSKDAKPILPLTLGGQVNPVK
jgi:hypothetical protein